jgi:hypothetical protein
LAIRVPTLVSLTVLSLACSTHMVPISYVPSSGTPQRIESSGGIRIGKVEDLRGTASNWLGAIRGGYGNPLKKLLTEKPTRDVVADAFRDALRNHGLSDGQTQAFELNIEIRKLDCSYYFNREAHAHLEVELVSHREPPQALYSRLYREDRTEGGVGAGIFGSVDHLRAFAEATLNGAIEQVFADPAFRRALLGGR